jgi:membrane carboxypeptidase/penicillin-binding protein
MTAAVAAVANGGYLMKPTIVRQIEDSEGRVVREDGPPPCGASSMAARRPP